MTEDIQAFLADMNAMAVRATDLYRAGEAVGYAKGFAAAIERIATAVQSARDQMAPAVITDMEKAAPEQNAQRWTQARLVLVKERYEVEPDTTLLLSQLSALPGLEITLAQLYHVAGKHLKLKRPSYRPEIAMPVVYTEERNALIRARYPTQESRESIMAAVNALPGPPCTLGSMTAHAAQKLKLKRPLPERGPAAAVAEMVRRVDPEPPRLKFTNVEITPEPPPQELPPIAPHPLSVVLGEPGPDGKIAASLKIIQQWCKMKGFGHFDGSQVDKLNAFRSGRNEPPVVVDWTA